MGESLEPNFRDHSEGLEEALPYESRGEEMFETISMIMTARSLGQKDQEMVTEEQINTWRKSPQAARFFDLLIKNKEEAARLYETGKAEAVIEKYQEEYRRLFN